MMKHFAKRLFVLLILPLLLCFTSIGTARAQSGRGVGIETFQPTASPGSVFETPLVRTKDRLEWSLGAFFHYAHEPVRREVTFGQAKEFMQESFPVALRFTADLQFALGLFGYAEIGLVVPVIVYQDGEGATPGGNIQHTGLGDPRLEVKTKLVEKGPVLFGLGGTLTLPLGYYASSGTDFMGYRMMGFEPRTLLNLDFDKVIVAANVGFLVRPRATIANYRQNFALTWNLALAVDIYDFDEPKGLRLALETNGEAGIDFDSLVEVPMEVVYGVKYRFPKDIIMSLGSSVALTSGVGAPSFRVFAGIAFDSVRRSCTTGPEDMDGFQDDDNCMDPDNDQDQILDEQDGCPNDAEDVDGFRDDDGCPDNDNDGDKIPDSRDKCPLLEEDFDDYEDNDGCPEEGPGKPMVKITDTQLLLSSKIYFDYDKDTINEVSYPILDAVGDALIANPHIHKVRIEGHSDNEGKEEYNRDLSERRAKSVMDYLIVNKRIQPERLTYAGYGFSRPKASNESDEGKAINRRVEFTILNE